MEDQQRMVEESPTNLIVKYLPETLTDEEFRSMFLSIGPIKSAQIVRYKRTGSSCGFGFVDFQHATDADRAILTHNELQMENKKIKVSRARTGGENIKGANLFVKCLPLQWTETEVNKVFEPYGQMHPYTSLG